MYLPDHFKQPDMDIMRDLIAGNPLATLVTQSSTGLRADQIPLILTKNKLIGHIAAANDLHRVLTDG